MADSTDSKTAYSAETGRGHFPSMSSRRGADVRTGRQLDIPQGRACNGGLQTIHIQPTTHPTRRCV